MNEFQMKSWCAFPVIFLLVFLTVSTVSIAQTPAQRKIFTEEYASRALKQFERTTKKEGTKGKKLALEYALKNRIPLRKVNIDGSVTELVKIDKFGAPIFYRTYNNNAALSTRASFLNSSGSLGLELDGENMTIGVWDGGHPRITHQEFQNIPNKVTIGEESTPTFTPTLDFHAAHVVGTITASGVLPSAKGMAPKSKVIAFDWNDDFNEAISQAFNGLLVSNHSYGWDPEELENGGFSSYFGAYVYEPADWDELMQLAPYYLAVIAAGNEGNSSYNSLPLDPSKSQYDKLSGMAVSKNGLTVAAANDAIIDSNGNLGSVTMASFSSQGPSDDLRIKPDITGNGVSLFSTGEEADNDYFVSSGTSMATPNVSGTLLLIQEFASKNLKTYLKAATLKGLVLHTADNIGSAGPDAISGWGLLNAKKAVEVLGERGGSTRVFENRLPQGITHSMEIMASGTEPLSVSISWTDPVGNENYIANSSIPALVNNLDLVVKKGDTNFYPWRLTSVDQNANDGPNQVDPFERVDVTAAEGLYTLFVSHSGNIGLGQDYSLTVTGVEPKPVLGSLEFAEITSNSAKISSSIVWEGEGGVSSFGFIWSESQEDFDAQATEINLTNKAEFFKTLSSLKPNTTYYVKAFSENLDSKIYTNLGSFKTLASLAELSSVTASDISSSSAVFSSKILSNGGVEVTSTGFVIGRSAGFASSEGVEISGMLAGEDFTGPATNLLPNTTYFVRAFAVNSEGRSESAEFSFTTLAALAELSFVTASDVSSNSAVFFSKILSNGGVEVTSTGFVIGRSAGFASSEGLEVSGTLAGEDFTGAATNLLPNTTYFVRAFAVNSEGRSESAEFSFTTLKSLAKLSSVTASDISSSSAVFSSKILSNGGVEVTSTGFLIGRSAGFASSEGVEISGMLAGEDFTGSATNLLPNTTYFLRAFAVNSEGRSESAEFSFTTLKSLAKLSFVTASDVSSNSAVFFSKILSNGGVEVTSTGFLIGRSAGFASSEGLEVSGPLAGEDFTRTETNLLPNTTYFLRAFAVNSEGRSESAEISFTTLKSLAKLSSVTASDISSSSAVFSSKILSNGGVEVTSTGFLIGRTAGFASSEGLEVSGTLAGEDFTGSAINLLPNTTYFLRAFAVNSEGRSESAEISFTTPAALAVISNPEISTITLTSALLTSNILNDWNAEVKEFGLILGGQENLNKENGTSFVSASQKTPFTIQINELKPGTVYYVRSYIENAVGTNFSPVFSFQTKADQEKPVLKDFSFDDELRIGIDSSLRINLRVTDNYKLKKVQIFYKGIRQKLESENWEFTENLISEGVQAVDLRVEIPKRSFDELGLMHYIRVEDEFNNVFESTISYTYLHYPESAPYQVELNHIGPRVSDYRMIGTPLMSAESMENYFIQAFQKNDPAIWRVFGLKNQAIQSLKKEDLPEPGKGFWAIVNKKAILRYVGTVSKVKHDNPVSIALEKGWNLLANPYPFMVNWEEVLAENEVKITSSLSRPVKFEGTFQFGDEIMPSQGFYIFSLEPVTIRIPFLKNNLSANGRIQDRPEEEGWELKLTLKNSKGEEQAWSSLGVNLGAKQGFDRFDMPLLPQLSSDFSIKILEDQDENFYYSRSIIQPKDTFDWVVELEKRDNDSDLLMSWEITGTLPDGHTIYLSDLNKQGFEKLDMSKRNKIVLKDEFMSRMLVQLRPKEKPLHESVIWYDPYPNPSNGVVTWPVQNFLNQEVTGEIKIYNTSGIIAKTISGVKLPYGKHLVELDLTSMPKGLYIIIFDSDAVLFPKSTQKIWLH